MNHVVLVYLDENSHKYGPPGVIGPFETIEDATKYARILIDQDSYWVKIGSISPPPEDWDNFITSCKFCKRTDSPNWWKCCPEHTTNKGPDVVCMWCAIEKHAPEAERRLNLNPRKSDNE